MTDMLPSRLNNEATPEKYFFQNDETRSTESIGNNSYLILAILVIIAGFVALATFVLMGILN